MTSKEQITVSWKGTIIGFSIIALWILHLVYCFNLEFSWKNPFIYLHFWIQTHLFTGLFITAHDAMHHTASPNKIINDLIGQICLGLYAFFPLPFFKKQHYLHHAEVATENDPDYHYEDNFMKWYFSFFMNYVTLWQILAYAIAFNVLKLWIPTINLVVLWIIPSVLSTLQLFYFGTYLPHRGEHDNIHNARSQEKNHLWAFLSCYFFGYHLEHHEKPYVPWWQLYKEVK